MQNVKIWDYPIGEGNAPFFVAELGICHGGKVDVALELAEAAVAAGVHCVKTETFQRHAMVFDPEATTRYAIHGEVITVPLIEHMEQYELSYEEHHKIKKRCDELGVPFISTAHDFEAIDFLCAIGAAGIKISSPDIIHYPLLRYAATKNLPIIMDTGGAFQYEVEIAVRVLREGGVKNIIVNHNPSGHPAPAHQHDLRIIPRYKELFQVPIGIADHYEGYEMLYAATILGTHLLEKPISKDRSVPEPERNWSISLDDLPEVLEIVGKMYSALGKSERELAESAIPYRNQNRMACVAAKALNAGDPIHFSNVIFGRPRKGIGVEYWDLIEGRKLRKSKNQYEFIQWEDLD